VSNSDIEAILAELEGAADEARTLLSLDQWREYFRRLEGPEGCDFQETPTWTWNCAGGTDQTFSRAILAKIGLDEGTINEVLQCVSSLGGMCDCEVLFNAAERIDP
jgi:hypothetical protein